MSSVTSFALGFTALAASLVVGPDYVSAGTLQVDLVWQRTFDSPIREFYVDTTTTGEPLVFVLTDVSSGGKVHQITLADQLTTVLDPPEGYAVSIVSGNARFLSYQSSNWSPEMSWSEYVSDFTMVDRNGVRLLSTSSIRSPERISNTGQTIVDWTFADTTGMDPVLDVELAFFDADAHPLSKLAAPWGSFTCFSPLGDMFVVNIDDSVLIGLDEQGTELWRTSSWRHGLPAIAKDGTIFECMMKGQDFYGAFLNAGGELVAEIPVPGAQEDIPSDSRISLDGKYGVLDGHHTLWFVRRDGPELLWAYSTGSDTLGLRSSDVSSTGDFVVASIRNVRQRTQRLIMLDQSGNIVWEEQEGFALFPRFVPDSYCFAAMRSRVIGLYHIRRIK